MIRLFFKFGQFLKFSNPIMALSPGNPVETLVSPDDRRQFQGDTQPEKACWVGRLLQWLVRRSPAMDYPSGARLVRLAETLDLRVREVVLSALVPSPERLGKRYATYCRLASLQAVL
jgi:hypothetical protein